jgi:ADP-heptose:LPS heptosyltransferase
MAKPFRILVFRFSALGDVAMVVPVLKLLLHQHPNLEVTVVSAPLHRPLFAKLERVTFIPVDFKKEWRGIAGLWRFSRYLKKAVPFDAIADLHDVIRSKVIRNLIQPKRLAIINKGRKEKQELTRPHNKILRPLRTTFQRYADVFEPLGFPVALIPGEGTLRAYSEPELLTENGKRRLKIGVAPFARHAAKMYPLEKMEQVLQLLNRHEGIEFFLFGSPREADGLKSWVGDSSNIHVVAGKFDFSRELELISRLDLMISMDSANMHLASMFGVRVVSVWGGTHPYLGFYGWGQDFNNAVQTDLPCRPSSVFGNKDCPVHGKAGCMQEITPGMIAGKVESLLDLAPE